MVLGQLKYKLSFWGPEAYFWLLLVSFGEGAKLWCPKDIDCDTKATEIDTGWPISQNKPSKTCKGACGNDVLFQLGTKIV